MHYIIPRQLIPLGPSLVVTVPQSWIRAHNLTPKDLVVVELVGRIKISSTKRPAKKQEYAHAD